MLLLDCGALPDEQVVAELAQNVSFIKLPNIMSQIISLREIKVEVSLTHAFVHLLIKLFYLNRL